MPLFSLYLFPSYLEWRRSRGNFYQTISPQLKYYCHNHEVLQNQIYLIIINSIVKSCNVGILLSADNFLLKNLWRWPHIKNCYPLSNSLRLCRSRKNLLDWKVKTGVFGIKEIDWKNYCPKKCFLIFVNSRMDIS